MLPGAGAPEAFGPSPHDIGQPVIQRNQGTGDDGEHNGSASVSMRFSTPYMEYIRDSDLTKFRSIVATMVNTAVAMSKGPYSLKLLAAMGHPYATAPSTEDRVKALRRKGHNVPRYHAQPRIDKPNLSIGHIKGIRGSVATLAVTNIQSGHFSESWSSKVVRDAGGVSAVLLNSAIYAYYLLEGTDKMIAHGPWEYVMKILSLIHI